MAGPLWRIPDHHRRMRDDLAIDDERKTNDGNHRVAKLVGHRAELGLQLVAGSRHEAKRMHADEQNQAGHQYKHMRLPYLTDDYR